MPQLTSLSINRICTAVVFVQNLQGRDESRLSTLESRKRRGALNMDLGKDSTRCRRREELVSGPYGTSFYTSAPHLSSLPSVCP